MKDKYGIFSTNPPGYNPSDSVLEKPRRGRPPGSSREKVKMQEEGTTGIVVGESLLQGPLREETRPVYTMIDDVTEEQEQQKAELDETNKSYIHDPEEGFIIFHETYLDALSRVLQLLSPPQRDRLVDFMTAKHSIPNI